MLSLPNSPFKAYDIRGRVPDQLDETRARLIGLAYARVVEPSGPVAIGYDMRHSSRPLAEALGAGLNAAGVSTRDIGLCGTEVVYHAASLNGMGGGIMITASHNPADYNGMKMVREQAIPLSADTGLRDMENLVAEGIEAPPEVQPGKHEFLEIFDDYVRRVKGFVDPESVKPLRIVVNAGNGCAGPAFDAIADGLGFEIIRLHHEPDGSFPNGVPNPLLQENRKETAEAVVTHQADLGIAWDGDHDRCFFFDHNGRFVEGYYLVGLFARHLLERHPGENIILDPRLTWNTLDEVAAAGGTPLINKSGHAFIKERMRAENALYGGEMSAHHYFREFAYCDSGMIPWLLLAQRIAETGKSLAELVDERIRAYPCSGEINFTVDDADKTLERVLDHFADDQPKIDRTDGISLEFQDWRFNLRTSNTEPVIRLNVETRADAELLKDRTSELQRLIEG